MRNMMMIAALSLMVSLPSYAGKAALVKLIKGEAKAVINGKEVKLKADDWVDGGAIIKTSEKSFVKLVFIDKSQMNVGPLSEIKIEKFHSKDAGVIDLVKGKIRSQVSKDYLQIQGKDRSKLFIKTKNAVMGIRGTDFMITTNGTNTAAILFEGEVVFNRLSDRKITDSAQLDRIVDQGVRMFPGEFSAVGEGGAPTVPALLNVGQREKLEKNVQFDKNDSSKTAAAKSIVPAGLSGNTVASKPNIEVVKNDDGKVRASANADSYIKDGQVKPVNGSFVHLDSATIIAPGKDAVLDENSNTYIASDKAGSVTGDGSYNPPKGVSIADDGKILVGSKEIAPNTLPITLVNQNPADQSLILDTKIVSLNQDYNKAVEEQNNQNQNNNTDSTGIVTIPTGSTSTGGVSGGVSGGVTGGTASVDPQAPPTGGGTVSQPPTGPTPSGTPNTNTTSGGSGGGLLGGTLGGIGGALNDILN